MMPATGTVAGHEAGVEGHDLPGTSDLVELQYGVCTDIPVALRDGAMLPKPFLKPIMS